MGLSSATINYLKTWKSMPTLRARLQGSEACSFLSGFSCCLSCWRRVKTAPTALFVGKTQGGAFAPSCPPPPFYGAETRQAAVGLAAEAATGCASLSSCPTGKRFPCGRASRCLSPTFLRPLLLPKTGLRVILRPEASRSIPPPPPCLLLFAISVHRAMETSFRGAGI